MGSSPSKSEVVEIRIPSSKRREISSDDGSSKYKENSRISGYDTSSLNHLEVDKLRKELEALKNELKMQKEKNSQAEEASFSFQTQLDERDREVLMLREEISNLQNTPSSATPDNSENEENYDRTVHAKDQYIKTLEDELKNMKQQTNTQNERYQKKIKKLKTVLSKSRQDSSLKLFELKDENSKLTGENTKLQERIERMSMDSGEFSRQSSTASTRSLKKTHSTRDHRETEDQQQNDTRMKLILELSEQVATLDAENHKLKQELKHCRKIQKIAEKVEKVRLQKKKNSESTTADVMGKHTSGWKAMDESCSLLEIGEKA